MNIDKFSNQILLKVNGWCVLVYAYQGAILKDLQLEDINWQE